MQGLEREVKKERFPVLPLLSLFYDPHSLVSIEMGAVPAARIEENFFIFVEVVTLIFVPHMGEVVKHPQVGTIEGVESPPAQRVADFKNCPCDKGISLILPITYRHTFTWLFLGCAYLEH